MPHDLDGSPPDQLNYVWGEPGLLGIGFLVLFFTVNPSGCIIPSVFHSRRAALKGLSALVVSLLYEKVDVRPA